MKHYGIEIIGRHYGIMEIRPNNWIRPVNGQPYRTEAAARRAAEAMGIEIEVVGDMYELFAFADAN